MLAHRDPANGSLGGVSVELAFELARRLGVEAELHPFDTAGKAFAALQSAECDIGFLAIDPKRAEDLDYTAPYVIIEGTYLVLASSSLHAIDNVDRHGVSGVVKAFIEAMKRTSFIASALAQSGQSDATVADIVES